LKFENDWTGNVGINVKLKRVREANFAMEKAINITYSEYMFVALFIGHSKLMHPVIAPPVACLAVSNLSTLIHKRLEFSLRCH